MKILFQGQVVKNLSNTNEEPIQKMKKLSKIIIKHSITSYSKAKNHRNSILHKAEEYKKYVVKQKKRLIQQIKKGNKPEMIQYMQTYLIDLDKCTVSYIR